MTDPSINENSLDQSEVANAGVVTGGSSAAPVVGDGGYRDTPGKTEATVLRNAMSDKLVSLAAGQAAAAATTWHEDFTNLTAWTVAGGPPSVSGNKLFGAATLGTLERALGIASGQCGRFAAKVHFKDPGAGVNGYIGIYLSSDSAATVQGGTFTNLAGIFIDQGTSAPNVRRVVVNVNGTAYNLAQLPAGDADYLMGIEADEQFLSLFIRKSDGTHEQRAYCTRGALGGSSAIVLSPNFSLSNAGIFIEDPRTSSGSYVQAAGSRLALAPVSPVTNVDDFTETVHTRESPAGQPARIAVPPGYVAGTPSPLVIYCHGGNSHYWEVQDTGTGTGGDASVMQPLFTGLGALGCIVASSSAGDNSFGNDAAVEDVWTLYQWLVEHYSIGQVFLASNSMGGALCANIIRDARIPVDGWIAIEPLTNLAWFNDGVQGGQANLTSYLSDWEAAWGLTGGYTVAEYHAAVDARDPNLFSPSVWRDVPILFRSSSADTVAIRTENAQPLHDKLSAAGLPVTLVDATGDHGDPSEFDLTTVQNWLTPLLRP